ncbi:Chain length determinant protein [Modicisalibacter ilicicola DSM 19980]|uniref:Chain length determinant protein n=1 Tax=Modicisalibacter ilicicola DSM 19980 TaxID=1121942 RepID=A0A1M5EP42_9GAMM|nr:Wzz/FepE/Etk N-terminal domain-containing protein [Halomonas ilicicola]SHF81063.1 Chain length determinant protein [Halomonas ilicicola DSM 19980]
MNPQDTPAHRYQDDEISLVDLAKILVKRWKALVVIFLVVVLAALAYALLTPRTYSYTSIYSVAEEEPGEALESPNAMVAKARNLYLGPETRKLLENEALESLPFDVKIDNPEETLLVTLSSEANEADEKIVAELHEGILGRLQEGQQSLVERRKQAMQRQLESAQSALESAQQSESMGAAEVVAGTMERIAELEASFAELREGEISQTAVQSLNATGTSRSLILALGIVLGGMLAVIGAFFLQFVSLVRDSLKDAG